MTTLPHLLSLRHPHRFWAVALMVSIISAIALDPWLQTMPVLVAIPVLAGGLLVAMAELWEELGGKPLTRAARESTAACRRP